jgi:hypothetical protein
MIILEEARHNLILIEHDPLLYEQAVEMTEYISKSISDAAKEAAVLHGWATWAWPTPPWATPAKPSSTMTKLWLSTVRSGTDAVKEPIWATWA